jgi:hypothetical protein
MKAIHAILFAGGVLLLVCGCTVSPPKPAADDIDLSTDKAQAGPLVEAYGFAVLDFRVRRDEYDRVYVVGEVKNTGILARGVELQATLRDADGRVETVGHFYPASYMNIQPGETWPFAYSFGRQNDATKAELRIVGAVRTLDILSVAYEPR